MNDSYFNCKQFFAGRVCNCLQRKNHCSLFLVPPLPFLLRKNLLPLHHNSTRDKTYIHSFFFCIHLFFSIVRSSHILNWSKDNPFFQDFYLLATKSCFKVGCKAYKANCILTIQFQCFKERIWLYSTMKSYSNEVKMLHVSNP